MSGSRWINRTKRQKMKLLGLISLLAPINYTQAKADFKQENKLPVSVNGHLLYNGSWVFAWEDGNLIKMVLTTHEGC